MIREIRSRLASLVEGTLTLQEFEDWFLPATWELSEHADPSAFAISSGIRLALGEYDHGDLSSEELNERFRDFAAPRMLIAEEHEFLTQATNDEMDTEVSTGWRLLPV